MASGSRMPWAFVTGFIVSLLGSMPLAIAADMEAKAVEVPETYMVEFMDNYDARDFYNELGAERIVASPRVNFTGRLFQGASFTLTKAEADEGPTTPNRIAGFKGVRMVYPVKKVTTPDQDTLWTGDATSSPPPGNSLSRRQDEEDEAEAGDAEPTTMPAAEAINATFSVHQMTQVDQLRALGYTGKGLRIALVDTGIDYNHPALGGCFGEGCVVSYGRDYVGDLFDEFAESKPIPDDDPLDNCNGHGTHTAGIIAAQENPFGFTGVAPGATLGAYRVSSCRGHVYEDIYIQGFTDAFEDGSDIISTSTLFKSDWSEDAASVVMSRIVAEGVPCIVPMGNAGQSGMFSTGSPAVARGVTAIGSVTNLEYPILLKKAQWSLGEDGDLNDFGWALGHYGNFGDMVGPLIYMPNSEDGSCENFLPDPMPDLTGYIVLIDMEGCPIYNKTNVLMDYGGRRIMVISPDFTAYEVRVYPLAVDGLGMVAKEQAEEWIGLLDAGEDVFLHMTYATRSEDFVYSPINTVSRGYLGVTSGWGMGWELDIKPQFAAPGGNILSTFPTRMSLGYAVKSGTSMASPFAAGVYALVMEATGIKDPARLEAILVSNSNPNLWFDGSMLHPDALAPVPQQGGGLVQALDAAMARTYVSTSGISFNDSDHFTGPVTFTIENGHDDEVTYSFNHMAAKTIYTATEDEFLLSSFPNPTTDAISSLAFSVDNVSIPAGGSAEVTVTATPPPGLDASRLPVYSGYIVINSTELESLSVPYVGVAGSMGSIPVVDMRPDMTYLQYWDTQRRTQPLEEGHEFTIREPSDGIPPPMDRGHPYPSLVVKRQAGTAYLTVLIEALDETDLEAKDFMGTSHVGLLQGYPLEYVPREVAEQAFAGVTAEGTVVPPGRYQFVIKALKIFGDKDNADDYQTTVVGPFVLRYGEESLPPPPPAPDFEPFGSFT